MSKTDKLLLRSFRLGYAIDTDEGTTHQWSYLEACGYVEKATRSGRGILGHRFARRITDTGRKYLETLIP
jgi:hypothetical protein